MGIYIDTETKRRIINIHDIDEFANNLKKYVSTYFDNLTIMDDEEIVKLNRLNDIANALLSHQFKGVLEPDIVIDYSPRIELDDVPF